MAPKPKAFVVVGVPGVGKSTAVGLLVPLLNTRWRVMRLDDSIGPAFACYPGSDLRSFTRAFHAFFTGWGAGYWLGRQQHVLIEGHLLNREERRRLLRGIRDLCPFPVDFRVLHLDGDLDEIAKRRAADLGWEPTITGPDRYPTIRMGLEGDRVPADVFDASIDVRTLTAAEVARQIVDEFGIAGELTGPIT
ncbi:MAG: hypothetical protein L3J96_07140 [Thermoplasmata archaeon]|nr:hypothetical protein [Thermoplasmata archaeon]